MHEGHKVRISIEGTIEDCQVDVVGTRYDLIAFTLMLLEKIHKDIFKTEIDKSLFRKSIETFIKNGFDLDKSIDFAKEQVMKIRAEKMKTPPSNS